MNLKEAFRWQNNLERLITNLGGVLNVRTHVVREERTHHYSDVIPTVQDKTEEIYEPYEKHSADELLACLMYLQAEKEALTKAIFDAKTFTAIDLDLANNVCRRNVLERLKWLLSIKEQERIIPGTGRTFNAEGNQVSYQYDISVREVTDFDQDKLKKVYRDLYETVEETSSRIDEEMICANVDFKPSFSLSDSLSDVIDFVCK